MKLKRFFHSWGEIEMMAANAAAERAGDYQPVAWLCPRAADRSTFRCLADHGDRNGQRSGPGICVAANYRYIEAVGHFFQAGKKFFRKSAAACSWQADTDHGRDRHPSH